MAQVILSTAGAAIGGAVGRFVGNVLGAAADRTIVNSLMPAREAGRRLTGLQLAGASEGDPVKQVFGRARVAGTVIWAARLQEHRDRQRASKTSPAIETFAYSLSFAVALCEGPIDGIGRIWADGQVLDQTKAAFRLYKGDEAQTPDSLIEAVEGSAPAYRGLAYLVFEDLDITPFGNRPPNLSVEVFRRAGAGDDLESLIEGVCLIPGAGEFVYATEPNAVVTGLSRARFETQNAGDGRTDFTVSLDQIQAQLPNLRNVTLVVSWFGTSLEAATCHVVPGVEAADKRTAPMEWSVAGKQRDEAHVVSQIGGRPAYGGTPSDATVVAAIRALKDRGYRVTVLPFILMDCEGYPWRGRITSAADMTPAAADAVAAFMENGFRQFVLHCAGLSVEAGGVDGILLGSELRGLTWLRSAANTYPMVAGLRDLAAEVRAVVGAATEISYGADWSEYFGHQPGDGHVAFHLDPLWADDHIDYVGIDWYAPLTDWREDAHLDAAEWSSIYDEGYLRSRIAGGEGFDWYYADDAGRAAQERLPISDGAYDEPWIYRPKDLKAWWSNPHHDRVGGVRSVTPTAWVPMSKPIRFVEIGCGAVDKGPNAPNLFLDPKSSESAVPPFSTGARDDRAQRAYLTAYAKYFSTDFAENNPVSPLYGGAMLGGMNVWCWDARPYPWFPRRGDVWGDSGNWRTGHWLNGRVGVGEAGAVIAGIAAQAGVTELDLSEVSGTIDGYVIEQPMTAAQALAPVLDWLGLEGAVRGGKVAFVAAGHGVDAELLRGDLAYHERDPSLSRRDLMAVPASLTLRCYDLDRDYQVQAVTVRGDAAGASQAAVDLPLCLTADQAEAYATAVLGRLQAVREAVTLDIDPLLALRLEIGDGLRFEDRDWRVAGIDLDETPAVTLVPATAARAVVHAEPSGGGEAGGSPSLVTGFTLMELPCFGLDESNPRPVLVPVADPWSGCDVYAGTGTDSLRMRGRVEQRAGIGYVLTPLPVQRGDYLLEGAVLDIYLEGESPVSRPREAVLSGANFVCVKTVNGEWEVIQYLNVAALGVDRYRLQGLVRGQWGSEQALAAGMAEGAEVVLLPDGLVRAEMTVDELGLERLWRVGRAGFGGAVKGAVDVTAAWTGLALRPRAPVHGRVERVDGSLRVTWIRRARYGGDGWEAEPPLCEDYERYRVRVLDGETLKREVEVAEPEYVYADLAGDFPDGMDAGRVEIAQASQVYGYGPVLRVGLGA